jgi:ubiquinone/menaquinone biosynthesis C-methylase UbiE
MQTELKSFDAFLNCWYYNTQMHIWRYVFASEFVKDRIVLDVACGVGYGTHFLEKRGARRVIGIDLSGKTLKFALDVYRRPNIDFVLGNALFLPFPDNLLDIAVSFETIEHIPIGQQEAFVAEIHRSLKPGGILLCSTPNHEFSPGHVDHTREFLPNSFFRLMSERFSTVLRYGQFITSEDLAFQQSQIEKTSFRIRRARNIFLRKLGIWLNLTPTRVQIKKIIKNTFGINHVNINLEPAFITDSLLQSLSRDYSPKPIMADSDPVLFGLLALCYK